MPEKTVTVEELEKELTKAAKDHKSEVQRLGAQIAELSKQLAETEAALQDAAMKGQKVSIPVPGEYTYVGEDADGKEVKTKFRFKPGRIRVPLADGTQVNSAALLRIANGGAPTEEEVAMFPALAGVTDQAAKDRMNWLIEKGAATLEKVD